MTDADAANEEEEEKVDAGWETVAFDNGCFWFTEAVFEELSGAKKNEPETVHAPKK